MTSTDHWFSHLHLSRTESEQTSDDTESEQSSNADSTSSLPDLVSLSGDESSEEDTDHLPPPIVNLDTVRLDVGLTRQTRCCNQK